MYAMCRGESTVIGEGHQQTPPPLSQCVMFALFLSSHLHPEPRSLGGVCVCVCVCVWVWWCVVCVCVCMVCVCVCMVCVCIRVLMWMEDKQSCFLFLKGEEPLQLSLQ